MTEIKALEKLRESSHLADKLVHYRPRTLEDVLRECAERYAIADDDEFGGTDAMFAEYADEIRELMGVDHGR